MARVREGEWHLNPKKVNPRDWYTVSDVAKLCRVSDQTVRDWRKRGKLKGEERPFKGERTRWFFKGSDVIKKLRELGIKKD